VEPAIGLGRVLVHAKRTFDEAVRSEKRQQATLITDAAQTAEIVGLPRHVRKCHHRKSVDSSITSSVHSSLLFGPNGLLKRSRAMAKTSVSGSARSS
jgi:hypothetical protein